MRSVAGTWSRAWLRLGLAPIAGRFRVGRRGTPRNKDGGWDSHQLRSVCCHGEGGEARNFPEFSPSSFRDGLLPFRAGLDPALIDLSPKATSLKGVDVRVGSQKVDSIAMELRTLTPKRRDLRQTSIYVLYDSTFAGFGAEIRHIIPQKVTYATSVGMWDMRDCIERLFIVVVCDEEKGTEPRRN